MKAAELVDAGRFELRDRERPAPGPTDVLVEVSDVGICGSDVHWYDHGRMGERSIDEPLVLGHESAGQVVAVGRDVDRVAVGDEVAIEPGVPCGHCRYCRDGRYNLCPDVEFMATPGTDGAFREYVSWPAEFVHELPPTVSTREGALCEPVSVGIQAVRRADLDVGDSVLVMGVGPIGLLTMDVARAAGAATVAVADIVPSKLDRATDRGADLAIDSRTEDVGDTLREEFDGGVDVVIEATGAPPAIEAALDAPRPGGTAVLVGLAPGETVPMDAFETVRRQIDIRGSYRFANTYPTALSLLGANEVDATGTIDVEMPLERIGDAFERAKTPDVIKGLLSVN
ncbi:NAD(P)-dependent alcohol dehydrogenase [Halalkalicoccus jeotgali]|uniref:L-threonine 3-dehydrogenase n=1 Tax=Halalkalicoccus jeotgali (strain DSM 18796 / CECT 7217 / JCM 14584 / KCTC 4019 / B3) TaxID=795797 RepID=D8J6I4_HALJB|nr:NAD(P)-dependent alcohol dehydrogenase [Halalkalicoccus jeotgali]ADJ13861.1 zinc-binding dehydrogenase [Halalkalicoccus jeotgali B3]ELY34093.1 zinc-binding dehydrogenase [Halalkalicoccus jeotgali B3]